MTKVEKHKVVYEKGLVQKAKEAGVHLPSAGRLTRMINNRNPMNVIKMTDGGDTDKDYTLMSGYCSPFGIFSFANGEVENGKLTEVFYADSKKNSPPYGFVVRDTDGNGTMDTFVKLEAPTEK